MNQRYALIAITIGLLLAGYLDGQDAKLMATAEESSVVVACIHCAGQP
jgi:hypothetical protein